MNKKQCNFTNISGWYKFLSNYSSLFIWPISYAFICWFIVYIQHPNIRANIDHIGDIDHSFYGLKQSLINLPMLLNGFILAFYYYVLLFSIFYGMFYIFRRSKYHIFASIPIITILSLFVMGYGGYPGNGIVWFEREYASKQILQMVGKIEVVAGILFILAYIHFVLILIIKRKQPFSQYIYVNVFTFFALWFIFHISHYYYTEDTFNWFNLIIPEPNSYFKIGLFWILLSSYLYIKKVNWKFIVLAVISFILFVLTITTIHYHWDMIISLILIFTSLLLVLFGLLAKLMKSKILIIVGLILFLIYCTLNMSNYNYSGFESRLIPYSWSY